MFINLIEPFWKLPSINIFTKTSIDNSSPCIHIFWLSSHMDNQRKCQLDYYGEETRHYSRQLLCMFRLLQIHYIFHRTSYGASWPIFKMLWSLHKMNRTLIYKNYNHLIIKKWQCFKIMVPFLIQLRFIIYSVWSILYFGQ